MNWYRTAQVSIKERSEHQEEYFDVGHKSYWKEDEENKDYKKFEEKTWIWNEGILHICDGDIDHELCARQNIKSMQNTSQEEWDEFYYHIYKGRYGNYPGVGKKVSLIVPAGREFYKIPPKLINDLMDTFGSDITIFRFN